MPRLPQSSGTTPVTGAELREQRQVDDRYMVNDQGATSMPSMKKPALSRRTRLPASIPLLHETKSGCCLPKIHGNVRSTIVMSLDPAFASFSSIQIDLSRIP